MGDDGDQDERGSQDEPMDDIPPVWRAALGSGKDDSGSTGAQVGKIVKVLNDIEDEAELAAELARRNPRNKEETLLMWATMQRKFVLVEWLIKRAATMAEQGGRKAAFAFGGDFSDEAKVVAKEMEIFAQWTEKRKEEEEARKEKEEARRQAEADGEEPPEEEEEEQEPLWKKVKDAMGDEELDDRMVQSVGQLGVFQGKREGGKKGKGTKWGLGQAIFPNGDMYVGEYAENRRHGYGTYLWNQEGNIYIGDWLNGQRSGTGRMVYANGGRYLGCWRFDKRNGKGRYTYPNGDVYSGQWVDDVKEGQGTFTFASDRSEYIGTFRNGDFVNGEWRLSGGTRYYGVFKNFKPVGKGIFVHRYGQEGSYTQDGSYVDGRWVPSRLRSADEPGCDLDITVQGRVLQLRFSDEAGGQQRGSSCPLATLVQVANFGPFEDWVRGLNDPSHPYCKKHFHVRGIQVRAVDWCQRTKLIKAVRIKVDAVSDDGERWTKCGFPDADSITLTGHTWVLVPMLRHGDEEVLLVTKRPLLACSEMAAPMLPEVTLEGGGAITGEIMPKLAALGLDVHSGTVENISKLTAGYGVSDGSSRPVNGMRVHEAETAAVAEVLYYSQDVTKEFWDGLKDRVAACNSPGDLEVLDVAPLQGAMHTTPDALSLAALYLLHKLTDAKRIGARTAPAMRPPTPPPPSAEERPEIPPPPEPEKPREAEAAPEEGGGEE